MSESNEGKASDFVEIVDKDVFHGELAACQSKVSVRIELPIVLRKRYIIAMTKFNDIIYEIAADNFGLITSSEAREAGITNNELVQYAKRGRIERVGQGVYRLVKRIPEQNDPYALAIALVGADAYLYGEAVLGMLELCPTNPAYLYVATPRRVRRNLPDYIRLVRTPGKTAGTVYDGIPCQRVADAICSARKSVMGGRLEEAAKKAMHEGYLLTDDAELIARELGLDRI